MATVPGGRKFSLAGVAVFLAALAPFTTNVSPNLAFAGAVIVVCTYLIVNVWQKK